MQSMIIMFKKLLDPTALHNAIRIKDEIKALKLIKNNFNINSFDAGCNPLQLSLLYDMFKCTIELLELNSDPNLCYKKPNKEKTIQPHVTGEDICNVKLLALYGATAENLQFNEENYYLKNVITKMNLIYNKRIELENNLLLTTNPADKVFSLKKLTALWTEQTCNEKNQIYQNFYFSKAENYSNIIIALNAKISSATAPEANYSHTPNQQISNEKEPLLTYKLKAQ